jgi:hypothetical protein
MRFYLTFEKSIGRETMPVKKIKGQKGTRELLQILETQPLSHSDTRWLRDILARMIRLEMGEEVDYDVGYAAGGMVIAGRLGAEVAPGVVIQEPMAKLGENVELSGEEVAPGVRVFIPQPERHIATSVPNAGGGVSITGGEGIGSPQMRASLMPPPNVELLGEVETEEVEQTRPEVIPLQELEEEEKERDTRDLPPGRKARGKGKRE